ncbi:MAG TPA: hypothetical protein VF834_23510 [Streptosporangiaceae bacterium]
MNAAGGRTARTPVPSPQEPAWVPAPPGESGPPRKPPAPDSGPALTRAWIAVALIPVFLFVAFAVGEGLTSLLGYPVGGSNPAWVIILTNLATLIAALLPCLAAVFYASRARKNGIRRAIVPLAIGSIVGLGWLILTVATGVGDLLR